MNERTPVHGDLLDEQMRLTLEELCQVCKADEHLVVELVREGVVEAWTSETDQWVFSGVAVTRHGDPAAAGSRREPARRRAGARAHRRDRAAQEPQALNPAVRGALPPGTRYPPRLP